MSLHYTGTRKLLEETGLSTEELTGAILNPSSYKEIWEKVTTIPLEGLHDTLCEIYYSGGRLTKLGILALRDYLEDADDGVSQIIIPTLEDLGLVELLPLGELTPDEYIIALTNKGQEVKPHSRFIPVPHYEEDQ